MYGKWPVACLVNCLKLLDFSRKRLFQAPLTWYTIIKYRHKQPCKQPAGSIGVNGKQPVACMATQWSCIWQVINDDGLQSPSDYTSDHFTHKGKTIQAIMSFSYTKETVETYSLQAAKLCLSAMCWLSCFGRLKGPAPQPGTWQENGTLWLARCPRMVFTTLNSFPQVAQVSSFVGAGPCFAFRWWTRACLVV